MAIQQQHLTTNMAWKMLGIGIAAVWAIYEFHDAKTSKLIDMQQTQITNLNASQQAMQEAIRALAVEQREIRLTKKDKE